MKKQYGFVAAALVAVMTMVGIGLSLPTTVQPVDAQSADTVTVERETLSLRVETSGAIAAERSIGLSFGVGGTVEQLNVEVGDEVDADALLASLETSDLEFQIALNEQTLISQQLNYDSLVDEATDAEIAQAQATLSSARSQLAQAQNSLENANNNEVITCTSLDNALDTLEDALVDYDDYVMQGYEWDADFIPDDESSAGQALENAQDAYEVAEAQCDNTVPTSQYEAQVASAQASVDAAQANLDRLIDGPTDNQIATAQSQVDQAQLRLENSQQALADAEIRAPFSGVVSAVNISEDQIVGTTMVAITLVDLSELHIDVIVDELDIPQIEIGQTALIEPTAFDNRSATGTVTQISPVGTNTDGIITYDVRINVDDGSSLPLFVGMTTDIEIIAGAAEDVLVVATDAIQRDGTEEFIEVVNGDDSRNRVPVETGITVDGMTVIEGDVMEGARVAIPERTSSSANNNPFGG